MHLAAMVRGWYRWTAPCFRSRVLAWPLLAPSPPSCNASCPLEARPARRPRRGGRICETPPMGHGTSPRGGACCRSGVIDPPPRTPPDTPAYNHLPPNARRRRRRWWCGIASLTATIPGRSAGGGGGGGRARAPNHRLFDDAVGWRHGPAGGGGRRPASASDGLPRGLTLTLTPNPHRMKLPRGGLFPRGDAAGVGRWRPGGAPGSSHAPASGPEPRPHPAGHSLARGRRGVHGDPASPRVHRPARAELGGGDDGGTAPARGGAGGADALAAAVPIRA